MSTTRKFVCLTPEDSVILLALPSQFLANYLASDAIDRERMAQWRSERAAGVTTARSLRLDMAHYLTVGPIALED